MANIKSIFEFKNYVEFLHYYLSQLPSGGHGEKSKFAEAMNCHNAYLSKILKKEADMSLEQTHALSRYLALDLEETDYFLLLVQHSRAGTSELRKYYALKIETFGQARSVLKNRFKVEEELAEHDKITYFSEWYYPVIHLMIATLPGFQNLRKIEAALSLSAEVIRHAVLFLERIGALEKQGTQFKPGKVNIHLGSDSAMISTYHSQWRVQAIRSLQNKDERDLHYSNIVTINEADFETIRNQLVRAIEETRKTVNESKNENRVAAMTLDWFRL